MTQDCSLSSSTAVADTLCDSTRLPSGIHVVRADGAPALGKEGLPSAELSDAPWGYLLLRHFAAEKFVRELSCARLLGGFVPQSFVHRSVTYRRNPKGKGVVKEEKPSVSGLVFLQGETAALRSFLRDNFPLYHLVNDCTTGRPASIPASVMRPFMRLSSADPRRVTFLRDPFVKFAKDHVKLRVLTGILAGQEGYVVRVSRSRRLVMDLGGRAVAISGVHNEDFEVAE